jgi:hypothetical protein
MSALENIARERGGIFLLRAAIFFQKPHERVVRNFSVSLIIVTV